MPRAQDPILPPELSASAPARPGSSSHSPAHHGPHRDRPLTGPQPGLALTLLLSDGSPACGRVSWCSEISWGLSGWPECELGKIYDTPSIKHFWRQFHAPPALSSFLQETLNMGVSCSKKVQILFPWILLLVKLRRTSFPQPLWQKLVRQAALKFSEFRSRK